MNTTNIYGDPYVDLCVIRLLGEHEKEFIRQEAENIIKESERAVTILTVNINDWDYEMSPWENKDAVNGRNFGSGAKDKLDSIINDIIPKYEQNYPNDNRKYIIAGYSLAGLFALWASYETDKFDMIMAASPSVWYPGWLSYINTNKCKAKKVYLSLGNKEHKTRNVLMATVADNIKIQQKMLNDQGVEVYFEENIGNHFKDVMERIIKGIIYLIND